MNHVKSRTKLYMRGDIHRYEVDYFDTSGRMITKKEKEDWFQSVYVQTDYYYDTKNDRPSFGFTTIKDETLRYFIDLGVYRGKYLMYDSVTTFFKYDSLGRLIAMNAKNRYNSYNINYRISYNPLVKEGKSFDSLERIVFSIKELYDDQFNITERVIFRKSHEDSVTIEKFNNSYDQNSRLINVSYTSGKCSSNCKLIYWENGLLKEKKHDKCFPGWKYKYKYFRKEEWDNSSKTN